MAKLQKPESNGYDNHTVGGTLADGKMRINIMMAETRTKLCLEPQWAFSFLTPSFTNALAYISFFGFLGPGKRRKSVALLRRKAREAAVKNAFEVG